MLILTTSGELVNLANVARIRIDSGKYPNDNCEFHTLLAHFTNVVGSVTGHAVIASYGSRREAEALCKELFLEVRAGVRAFDVRDYKVAEGQ